MYWDNKLKFEQSMNAMNNYSSPAFGQVEYPSSFPSSTFEKPYQEAPVTAQDILFSGLNDELRSGEGVKPQTQPNAMMGRPETPNTRVKRGLEPVTREQVDAAYAATNQAPYGLPQTTPGVAFDTSSDQAAARKRHFNDFQIEYDNAPNASVRPESTNSQMQAQSVYGTIKAPITEPVVATATDINTARVEMEDNFNKLVEAGYDFNDAVGIVSSGPEAVTKALAEKKGVAVQVPDRWAGIQPITGEGLTVPGNEVPKPADYTPPTNQELQDKLNFETAEKDERGIRKVKPADTFEIPDYHVSDGGALWRGLLAGGFALLGAAITRPGSDVARAMFFNAFGQSFGDSLNKSARYKNVDALIEEGYTKSSINDYINTGDRGVLAKRKGNGEWKIHPKTGVAYRETADGDIEYKGEPVKNIKPVKVNIGDYAYDALFDYTSGEYVTDGNGNIQTVGQGSLNAGGIAKQRQANQGSQGVNAMKLEQENKLAISQANMTLKKIDEVEKLLSNKETGTTGPLDYIGGTAYQYGITPFGWGKTKAEAKSGIERLQNDLLADVKPLFGPQISNSDIKAMMKFDLLDPMKSEEHNIEALRNIKQRIEERKAIISKEGVDSTSTTIEKPQQQNQPKMVRVGDVVRGKDGINYRYTGGDVNSKSSWEPI